MHLEHLPNELLLKLFDYLSVLHAFQAFANLNGRFRSLVLTRCQQARLDFRSISKTDFDTLCRDYLPLFSDDLLSLRLANGNNTPQQIALFLSYGLRFQQFTHLRSLSLSHICSSHLLEQLLSDCAHLPCLGHLSLSNCQLSVDRSAARRLYDHIWRLPKLTHCCLDIHFAQGNHFPTPNVRCTSLTSLTIVNTPCCWNSLTHLLRSAPNLEHLSVAFVGYVDRYDSPLPPLAITRLHLSFDCSLNVLQHLLQNLPDLQHLTLETSNIHMDGTQWEELISTYLLHLQILRFKMRFSPSVGAHKEEQIDALLDSFRTKFWVEERRWFVRCHWYASDDQYSLDFIDLFTLPYMFKEFLSYTGCILAKSTWSDDDAYWSFNRVNQLCYGSTHFTSSLMSRVQFTSIQHLSLSLPFNEQFLAVVPKLDRLVSLIVSINNSKRTESIDAQLQQLLERAVHLTALSFGSWCGANADLPFTTSSSKSVRTLNFNGYFCGKNWRCFDDEHCTQLIQSPLGKQCETLLIKVQSRANILELVHRMVRLQALHVRCDGDNWRHGEDLASPVGDELIEWLRDSLPASCSIARDTIRTGDIHLWIR